MATTRVLFNEAVIKLEKLNGLYGTQELIRQLALQEVASRSNPASANSNYNDSTRSPLEESHLEAKIAELFLNTYDGALTSTVLLQRLNDIVGEENENPELIKQLWKTFQVYHTGENYTKLIPPEFKSDLNQVSINSILGYPEGQDANNNRININPNTPNKETPGLSVLLSNNYMIGLNRRDINPVVVFLNNVPNVEMNRCSPFVNLSVIQGRSNVHEPTKRLQSISLNKFLLGAEKTEDGSMRATILRGEPASILDSSGAPVENLSSKSVVGMEIFTAPQTLVNANQTYNRNLQSNEVLDRFQPLLTLNDISLNVVPSTGMMSYKSGQISMTLHDRSRLAEVADFVRVDLYGTTELLLEYGWLHPDGESSNANRNPYGDLINGMRLRELYHIVNSSFSLNDDGSITITLQIAMRGGTDFALALIGSDSQNSNQMLQEVQRLQQSIAELRNRIFGNRDQSAISEIRGIQILDSAQDAINMLSMPQDVMKELRKFEKAMSQTELPNSSQLVSQLQKLFGQIDERSRPASRRGNNTPTGGGRLADLRRSVQDSIKTKMTKLAATPDPLLVEDSGVVVANNKIPGRVVGGPRKAVDRKRLEDFREKYNIEGTQNISVSLGKLLLLFVGEPLANTGRYDDVQMVFYPFNSYAGAARGKNIANFAVDLEYFSENFFRWRLERLGQTTNVNLSDFMKFLQEVVIDDPAARAYGLQDGGGVFFRDIPTDENGVVTEATDAPEVHMDRIHKAMKKLGIPNGELKMPQIECYVEVLPEKRNAQAEDVEATSEKSILRIHFFDRQTSPYDSLGALLQSVRNNSISAVGSITNSILRPEDNPGVNESMSSLWTNLMAAADESGILERIPGTGDGSETIPNQEMQPGSLMYRIKGGPQEIKKFLYNTMPYVRYGAIGSNVQSANLSSLSDPALNTVNLLRSFRRSDLEPNGENPGGLPMRIIPTESSLTVAGCPLINFAQQFFIDFQTGTTADNMYGVVGLSHKIGPGEFSTDIKLCPLDSYGQYFNLIDQLQNSIAELKDLSGQGETENGQDGNDGVPLVL